MHSKTRSVSLGSINEAQTGPQKEKKGVRRPARCFSMLLPFRYMMNTDKSVGDDQTDMKERLFVRHSNSLQRKLKNRRKYPQEKFYAGGEDSDSVNCKVLTGDGEEWSERTEARGKQDPQSSKTNNIDENVETKTSYEEKQTEATKCDKTSIPAISPGISEEVYICRENKKVGNRKRVRSFIEAENEGDTELYRQRLIADMDESMKEMKLDGFVNEEGEDIIDKTGHHSDSWVYTEQDILENLSDDLETGSSFVEAYNDEGRELIIAEVIIERKTVTFGDSATLDETIRDNIGESEFILIENSDKEYDVVGDDLPKLFSLNGEQQQPSSNRSTIYSTASESGLGDDEVFVDDEEKRAADISSRRETYCDQKGNVRIERSGSLDDNEDERDAAETSNTRTPLIMLSHIVEEIKSTEKKYVSDLAKVVEVYKPVIEVMTPVHQQSDLRDLFGNIEEIYISQQKLLLYLERCSDAPDVVRTFIDHGYVFSKYPAYLMNKPKADRVLRSLSQVIKGIQDEVDDRIDFSAYLLTPLQRLGKYILFLENIMNHFQALNFPISGCRMALNIVKKEMSKGNDYVAIESIQNSPISRSSYGNFIMRENFTVIKPRKMECTVFLFGNVVVFTSNDMREMEMFHYLESIKTNDLRIATFDDLTIHLTDYTKSKRKNKSIRSTYVLEAKTEKIRNLWKKTIEDILWTQLLIAKETVKSKPPDPVQNQRTISKRNRKIRARRGLSSIFYAD